MESRFSVAVQFVSRSEMPSLRHRAPRFGVVRVQLLVRGTATGPRNDRSNCSHEVANEAIDSILQPNDLCSLRSAGFIGTAHIDFAPLGRRRAANRRVDPSARCARSKNARTAMSTHLPPEPLDRSRRSALTRECWVLWNTRGAGALNKTER